MNVSAAQTALKSFNKAGFRLIKKETGLQAREILSGIEVPKKAVTMDVVNIESHFGDGSKTILQYKDPKGRVLKTAMESYFGDKFLGKTEQVTTYTGNVRKTVSKKYNANNELYETGRHAISVEKSPVDGKPQALSAKFVAIDSGIGYRTEHQAFEELHVGGATKYLNTYAKRHANGMLTDKSIAGNVGDLDAFAKDPYLFIRQYSEEDFLMSAAHYAAQKQGIADRGVKVIETDIAGSTLGYSCDEIREIFVDLSKHNTISSLVDTLNHEMRHQFQSAQMEKMDEILSSPIFTRAQKKYVKKCANAEKKYTQTKDSYWKYRSNFLEKDAFARGSEAASEYEQKSRNLVNAFGARREDFPVFRYKPDTISDNLADVFRALSKCACIKAKSLLGLG